MLMMSKTCLKQTCCATFSADRTAFRPVQKLAVAAAVTSTALLHLGPGVTFFTLNCMKRKTQQEPKHEADWGPYSVSVT